MPTGYTHEVQDGKVTTLRQFALLCARNFGALIMMRDDPMDAPVPEKMEPNTAYHDSNIEQATRLLEQLPALSADECDKRAAEEFRAELESRNEYASERCQTEIRYNNMLTLVDKWEPDEKVSGLKSFMAEQLRSSIDFDCREYRQDPPTRLTGERWREKTLAKASHDLAYHTLERDKEIQRTASRNEWLAALWASLPPVQP